MTQYAVLIGCVNDKTGKRYAPGDVVLKGDFPVRVIKNWLEIDPPVLAPLPDDDLPGTDEEE